MRILLVPRAVRICWIVWMYMMIRWSAPSCISLAVVAEKRQKMTTISILKSWKPPSLPISRQREILWYLLTNATELSPVNSIQRWRLSCRMLYLSALRVLRYLRRIKRSVSKFSVHTFMLTNITKALPMALCWIFVMNIAMSHRICLHRIELTSGLM